MAIKKKQFSASLIKYKDGEMKDPFWFWVSSSSGSPISPKFSSPKDAEEWYDSVISIHNETFSLLERSKDGKIYRISGRVSDEICQIKPGCTFTRERKGDIISFDVLGLSVEDARNRVEEYFEILEWIV